MRILLAFLVSLVLIISNLLFDNIFLFAASVIACLLFIFYIFDHLHRRVHYIIIVNNQHKVHKQFLVKVTDLFSVRVLKKEGRKISDITEHIVLASDDPMIAKVTYSGKHVKAGVTAGHCYIYVKIKDSPKKIKKFKLIVEPGEPAKIKIVKK